MNRPWISVAAALALLLSSGCGDSSGITPPPEDLTVLRAQVVPWDTIANTPLIDPYHTSFDLRFRNSAGWHDSTLAGPAWGVFEFPVADPPLEGTVSIACPGHETTVVPLLPLLYLRPADASQYRIDTIPLRRITPWIESFALDTSGVDTVQVDTIQVDLSHTAVVYTVVFEVVATFRLRFFPPSTAPAAAWYLTREQCSYGLNTLYCEQRTRFESPDWAVTPIDAERVAVSVPLGRLTAPPGNGYAFSYAKLVWTLTEEPGATEYKLLCMVSVTDGSCVDAYLPSE